MPADITLTKIYNPLNRGDQDTITWEHRPGLTVADLLDHTGARLGMAHRDSLALVVSVDGRAVPASQYTTTTLVPGQHVTLMPVLTGGGGGKDVLRMVGVVVLAIVATVAQQYWATALVASGWGATAATAISMVGAAAIMVGGSMLINSLLPPVMPKNPALNGYGSIDQSNSYSWNPQNTQQQGIAIPWYYGTCKLNGNVIGVYRETIGKDVYLNALISIGAGVLSGLSDFKINGQPYGNYRGIELHTRLGHLTQETIPNFGDTKVEYSTGTKVVYGAPVTYSTIGSSFDGLEVDVGFPNGLYYYDDYGKLQNFSVRFSVEIKKQGDVAWTVLTQSAYQYDVSAGGYWSAGYWDTNSTVDEYGNVSGGGWIELANGGTDPNAHYPGQYYNKYATWQWLGAEQNIANGINNYVTVTAASTGSVTYTYKDWDLEPGTYDVRVTRLTVDQTDTRFGDDFYIIAVREVVQDDFTYPGQALIGLRALATDQLSGSFSFECRTTGKLCRVYNGSTWSVAATSNPAWVCFDILTQPVFDASLTVLEYAAHDPANLDLARWYEWAQYCDDLVPDGNGGTEPRLTYNGTFDAVQSMWDAALSVAKIGRATPYWRGTTITISIDKPADPVTLITVGNIGLDSFEETFLSMENRAGSVEADFLNLDKDLDRDKFTVINPSAPAEWGSASLQLQGVIKPSEVWRHCRYYLATTQNLTREVTVSMDTDSIAFTLGDVINVQHDVPMWGEGGRLVAATETTIEIDREVTIESGKTYAVMIRLLDGTLVERTISDAPGSYTTLTVSTPFAAMPEQYDVYAFGETNLVVKPMRVVGIDPAGDLKRKITLTDYNPTIYNADLLQPVLPTVNYSAPNLPAVTGLAAAERMVKRPDGTIDEYVVVTFIPPSDTTNWIRAEIWVMGAGAWFKAGESSTGAEVLFSSQALQTYIVKAVSIDRAGLHLSDHLCPLVSINTLGKTAPPANVASATATVAPQGVSLTWPPVADVDLEAYLVRQGATWSGGVQVAKTPDTTALLGYLPVGTTTIKVKALDTSGNESLTEATTTATVQAPAAPAPGATIEGTDCTISWNDCTTSYWLDRYEIRYGASFESGIEISTVKGQSLKLPVTWTGPRTYWVRAVDAAGNAGTAGSVVVTIGAASAPGVSATLSGTLCKLTWTIPAATLPIDRYEIRIGTTWATATSLGTVKGTAYSLPATWPSAQLWVAAIDVNNTTGTPVSVSVTVSMPVVSGLTADVIDNNVLLSWTGTPGSLQIDHYEVRRGATWAAGSVVGSATGTFSLLFESASGTYTYWVAGYDAAGNQGSPLSVTAAVSQPPDYILNVDWSSTLSGTKTNLFNDPVSGWVAMVQTGETWAQHFTNNSKTSIQQFIDAGYTKYLQPSAPSAQYVETFDYGTLLAGTKITVALNHTALIGAPVVQCTIETSPDATTWTSFANMWQAYGTAFRYVRITLNWSATGEAIDQVSGLNVRLDSKIRNDAGSGTVTVAANGAACSFNIDFVDVTSITVTPSGTTAKYAIYDFVDVPNPSGFTVYLYDSAGNRTTGSFSWSARGY